MHNHIRDEIDTLLGKIDEAHASLGTNSIHQEGQLSANESGRPTLHVYILNQPLEELLTEQTDDTVVESDVETSSSEDFIATPDTLSQFPRSFPCSIWSRKQRYVVTLLLAVLTLLGAFVGIATAIMTAQAPSASVILIPAQKEITVTTPVEVTLGKPDMTHHEIQGRLLSSMTLSQARMVTATGTGYQEARVARGSITFYNAQPSMQVVAAGTLMTGADGVSVVTDRNAVIPAAVLPTDGQTTVLAHATITGPAGNIRAGDMYGACCRLNIFATNGVFRGGQNAHTFSIVTQQDIYVAVSMLKSNLAQSINAAFQAQVRTSETLVTPVPCTPNVTTDHPTGTEVTQVSVTLNETCTGEVYNTRAFDTLLAQITSQAATKQLGADYSLTSDVQVSIIQSTVKDQKQGAITLQVKGAGVWFYRLRRQQLEQFKSMIAGKSIVQAKAVLLHTVGVNAVSLSIKNGTAVPADKNRISFVVVQPG